MARPADEACTDLGKFYFAIGTEGVGEWRHVGRPLGRLGFDFRRAPPPPSCFRGCDYPPPPPPQLPMKHSTRQAQCIECKTQRAAELKAQGVFSARRTEGKLSCPPETTSCDAVFVQTHSQRYRPRSRLGENRGNRKPENPTDDVWTP